MIVACCWSPVVSHTWQYPPPLAFWFTRIPVEIRLPPFPKCFGTVVGTATHWQSPKLAKKPSIDRSLWNLHWGKIEGSLVSRPSPTPVRITFSISCGKDGLVTSVTFSCLNGMCNYDISHANNHILTSLCCLPMPSVAAAISMDYIRRNHLLDMHVPLTV